MQTELSAAMYLTDPSQTHYVVFNNPSDANFVGYITDITGFDSPEVRENAQNINAGDGGRHGTFWHGRRPFTVSGLIVPSTPATARSAAQSRLDSALNLCLRADGYLVYTPSDAIARYLRFRKQQPHRISSSSSPVQKQFQISGVSRDWRFYTAGGAHGVFVWSFGNPDQPTYNSGTAIAPVVITINGPIDQPDFVNTTTGQSLTMPNMPSGTIVAGDQLKINLTGQYPTCLRVSDGLDLYGYIDPTLSDFEFGLIPGTNWFALFGSNVSGTTTVEVQWNDAWN